MTLSRDEILERIEARSKETDTVPVPEWGGEITLRKVGFEEVTEAGYLDKVDAGFIVRFLAIAICNGDGKAAFSKKDIAQLGKAEPGVVLRIFDAAAELNNLSAEAVEQAAEAFGGAQPGDDSSS